MTKILVTGGAGFIGSHIVERYQGKAEIRVLDNLRTGFYENIKNFDCEFIKGDITNREDVAKAVQGVDYIFHLAAMISVPESVFRRQTAYSSVISRISVMSVTQGRSSCAASSGPICAVSPSVAIFPQRIRSAPPVVRMAWASV